MGATGSETPSTVAADSIRDPEGKKLVGGCLAGDPAARRCFQERFGPLVYRFVDCHGADGRVEAGDFYLYAFEHDRLYRRLRTYKGVAGLTAFLRGYTLPDLLSQFQAMRARKRLETISLDSGGVREPIPSPLEDSDGGGGIPGGVGSSGTGLLAQLSAEKRLLIKLLCIDDFDLDADDVRFLARRSGRPVRKVLELIEQARESVHGRELAREQKRQESESAAQWILNYQRREAQLRDSLANVPPRSTRAERLRAEKAELERKQAWRQRQRERALADSRRTTVTLRYREIAEILNVPIGSVSAQVTRLRQELLQLAGQQADANEGT